MYCHSCCKVVDIPEEDIIHVGSDTYCSQECTQRVLSHCRGFEAVEDSGPVDMYADGTAYGHYNNDFEDYNQMEAADYFGE